MFKKIREVYGDIKLITSHKNKIEYYLESCLHCGGNKELRLAMIEEALSKRRSVTGNEYEDDDGDDEYGRQIIRRFYGCPTCNATLYPKVSYCDCCGQKLSWR